MANQNIDIIISAKDYASKALQGVEGSLGSVKSSIERNQATFQKMATIGAASFVAIGYAMKKTLDSAGQLESAMKGLESIVEGTGNNFDQAQGFLEDFTKDGLVPMNNAATSLKNLLAKGFSLKEATELMDRFKDSASFGRQAALSLGDAVQTATEGIKNENSVLVDNAGVTKNISVMQKEYADSLGITVAALTDAQKNEAIYQGILKETEFQVGDAKKASEGYQGQVAKLNASKVELSQTIGNALMPVMTSLLEKITPIIGQISDWMGKNPELTKTIIIATLAISGIIAVVGTLGLLIPTIITGVTALGTTLAFLALNPIGMVITAIAAGVAIGVLIVKNWDKIKAKAVELGEFVVGLYDKYQLLFLIFAPIIAAGIEIYKNWDSIKQMAAILGQALVGLWENFIKMKDNVIESGEAMYHGFIGWVDSLKEAMFARVGAIVSFVSDKVTQMKNMLASIGGGIKNAASAVSGAAGAVGDVITGTRAEGGNVSAGKTYLVGEKGRELFVPKTSGTIVSNDNMGATGGVTINMGGITVQNSADEDRLIQKMKIMLSKESKAFNLGIS